MKRLISLLVVLFFASVGSVYADVYMTKKAGDDTVTVSFEKQPVIGENYLAIRIEDKAGKSITDAKVSLNYYMTAQRQSTQMPYMESSTDAEASSSGYKAKLILPMKGPWYIKAKITRGGQEETATFHFHLE